ncbi:hypothetical protein [Domibacillus enclensis]|uniref:Histidine kinase n=1 Tax=Domibacillus enclensis TaxID=1017273 RepID=A0A1N7BR68_9BACI|nr:hypothetical protein [Domibacillus enclensis]OXS74517.1 hypothetical protein B1B05_16635 [Domibacillus enclensis]SIR53815.1 hypothetical protein SAMN05443094_11034 [Domibacillus enclensis]
MLKRFVFVIPVMVIVFSVATWMLNKDYAMIERDIRLLISGGAAVFSGVITFFLMKGDAEHLVDAHRERKENKKK